MRQGLRFSDTSGWHYSYLAFADIRMPLFTLISGYVYAMIPVANWGDYPGLMRAKARRLLFPLITVSMVLYLVKRVVPGLNSDVHKIPFWQVYVYGFEYLWFLQAIFVIFLIVGVLDGFGLLATRARWIGVTAISAIVFVAVHVPDKADIFSFNGTLRLLPFFLLGYGLRRHKVLDLRGPQVIAMVAAFTAVYSVRLLTIFGVYHPHQYMERTIAVTVGVAGVVLIYSVRRFIDTRLLAWIGGYSFGIFLLHVFAAAGTRVAFERLGVNLGWAMFIVGLVMGVFAPIVFQILFRNVPVVQTFVLGEKWVPRRHARPASAPMAVADEPAEVSAGAELVSAELAARNSGPPNTADPPDRPVVRRQGFEPRTR